MFEMKIGQFAGGTIFILSSNKSVQLRISYRRTRCLNNTLLKQSRERSEERQNLIGEIYNVKSLNAHMIGPGQCTVI